MQSALNIGIAAAALVYVESNRDRLIRQVWIAGSACLLYTLVLAYVMRSNDNTRRIIYILSAAGVLVAATIGWWASLNKKDDLNMSRAVDKFRQQLDRMKSAEDQLKGALDAMLLQGADMAELDAKIKKEAKEVQSTIDNIAALNQAAINEDKLKAHEQVLMQLADVNGSRSFDREGCARLVEIIENMSGRQSDDADLVRIRKAIEARSFPIASTDMHRILGEQHVFDIILPPPDLVGALGMASMRPGQGWGSDKC
jgi:hypothetical protein